jgi:hypothetical protein
MKTSTMLSLVSPRYIEYAVGAVLFKVLVVLMLINCFPGTVFSPSVTQAYWGISGSPLEETPRDSEEFSEHDARQTKGEPFLQVLDRFLSRLQQNFSRPWVASALAPLFVVLFLPWQFLPVHPLADDDPLLS